MLWSHATGSIALDRPRVVGILNVTPDSFSDGGLFRNVDDARRQMDRLVEEGVDVLDIGGESTRPQGAAQVTDDEEIARVLPVIEAAINDHPSVPVSVDTTKSVVARRALDAGVSIVNDVSAFRLDAEMPRVCAEGKAGIVLMHSRGGVTDMATFAHAHYGDDVVGEVLAELAPAIARATQAGVDRDRVALDPGIGFSKRGEHSLAMLAGIDRLAALGFPVLVGVSRKRFIGEVTGTVIATERVWGTVGANVAALERGARLFRVHDVRPNRHALDVAWAIISKQS
ncbi:MAG TPA: dihydropteroate synthase [Gemmatimonadaceae bacterium]|jgi:dihydropteroate synthase